MDDKEEELYYNPFHSKDDRVFLLDPYGKVCKRHGEDNQVLYGVNLGYSYNEKEEQGRYVIAWADPENPGEYMDLVHVQIVMNDKNIEKYGKRRS